MPITRGELANPLFDAWLSAGEQAGYPRTEDYNGASQEGVCEFDRTIAGGRRQSTSRTYLRHRHRNLTVRTGCRVTRVDIADGKARGVYVLQGSGESFIAAEQEVIVAGGAINSPQLLMLSGIGDPDELGPLGLPCVSPLKEVGRNLQDHLEFYVQYHCSQPVSVYKYLRWYRQPFVGLQWYLNQTGAGATNHFEAGAFLRSSESQQYPDLQFHFLPVAMNYDGSEKIDGHGFQVHVGPMKPTSRGRLWLDSVDPLAPPRFCFNYHATEADQQTMFRGIRLARELVSQSAFDGYRGAEARPGEQVSDDQSLDAFVRDRAESAYHPSGTCRMGTNPDTSVVDQQGRVHGIAALRVVDASIMPEITNGNLNAPVIMMAEKISADILAS